MILTPFLPEAVEADRCYFFENWVKKLKCPHLLKPVGTIFHHNYWSFYTSESFTLARFNMRHPVDDLCLTLLQRMHFGDRKLHQPLVLGTDYGHPMNLFFKDIHKNSGPIGSISQINFRVFFF